MTKKTILITGGTGKFGKIFATHFAKNGWRVVITSTCQSRAEDFKVSFPEGENIHIFISDLSQPNAAKELIEAISARGIQINHLVNNARSLKSLAVGNDGFSRCNCALRISHGTISTSTRGAHHHNQYWVYVWECGG